MEILPVTMPFFHRNRNGAKVIDFSLSSSSYHKKPFATLIFLAHKQNYPRNAYSSTTHHFQAVHIHNRNTSTTTSPFSHSLQNLLWKHCHKLPLWYR
jgi:hypothetical protein